MALCNEKFNRRGNKFTLFIHRKKNKRKEVVIEAKMNKFFSDYVKTKTTNKTVVLSDPLH